MQTKSYRIIIPILITGLFFASLAGIIGNAIMMGRSTNRNFHIANLQPGELKESTMTIPEEIGRAEIKIFVLQNENPTTDNLNIYLSTIPKPSSINTITILENSTFFTDDLIDYQEGVSQEVTFYPPEAFQTLYIIWGNPEITEISFSVDIKVSPADTVTGESAAKVLAIVFSSIFTFIFFVLGIYLWFEFLARSWYTPKILTDQLDKRIEGVVSRAESWEIVLLIVSAFSFIVGYGTWLLGNDTASIFFSTVMILFVYYSYNNRQKKIVNIKMTLQNKHELSLDELSKLINEDKEDTKKALLDMIMYDKFPATYDFDTEQISYDPKATPSIIPPAQNTFEQASFEVPATEVVSRRVDEKEEVKRPMPECAYCGVTAISAKSQFCHSCGASMTSAK